MREFIYQQVPHVMSGYPMRTHLSADCYISVPDNHIRANSSERFCDSHVAVSMGILSGIQVLRSSSQCGNTEWHTRVTE